MFDTTVLTRGTVLKGWVMTVPADRRRALSKGEMADEAADYLDVWDECRTFIRHRDRLGDGELAARTALGLVDMVRNALRGWLRADAFNCYYQVYSSAVHKTMYCKTLNIYTTLSTVPTLAGVGHDAVAEAGYRLCAHCGVSDDAYIRIVEVGSENLIKALLSK